MLRNRDLLMGSPTVEEFGHFGSRGKIRSSTSVPHCCQMKTIVRGIAAIDIFYALFLIGFHLLSLVVRRAEEKGHSQSLTLNFTTQSPPISIENLNNDEVNFSTLPPPRRHGYSSKKIRETMEVLIWVWLFAISILQLLVASALYGGTKQREARICFRNCGIWAYTSTFLLFHILIQISWILIQGKGHEYIFRLFVYSAEILFRLVGLLAIHQLKKQIKNELCDSLEVMTEGTVYYELQRTTPSPVHKQLGRSTPRPSRRHYNRTPVWDDLDMDQV